VSIEELLAEASRIEARIAELEAEQVAAEAVDFGLDAEQQMLKSELQEILNEIARRS
jgi:hypothetical protein